MVLVTLIAAQDPAGATSSEKNRSVELAESRPAGEPIMAIVSLHNQRITVYDATGWILRAPVSSGQKGRETPAGVFKVLQKNAEHWSNFYDDGRYASHAAHHLVGHCTPRRPPARISGIPWLRPAAVRLRRCLFDATRMGMRVIVAPGDVQPLISPIQHCS